MMGYLDDMTSRRSASVEAFVATLPGERLRVKLEQVRDPLPFAAHLVARDDVAVIAEFKRASPSAGPIAPFANPVVQARAYVAGGAACISCLTEPEDFKGSFDDLSAISRAVKVPVLAKDFTVSGEQLALYRAFGADACLIIVGQVGDRLPSFIELAVRIGLAPVVEVHDGDELATALGAHAPLIAVNARDLQTFTVDLEGTHELIGAAKASGATVIAASGIASRADVERAAAAGADAVLVGESLMRAADPQAAVTALTGVPRRREPHRTGIKMCGFTDPAEAVLAAETGVDAIGVVFAQGSPRQVTPEQAAGIFQVLPRGVRRVGVFADDPLERIDAVVGASGIDSVQLHGDESPLFCSQVGRPVIRSIRVAPGEPLPLVQMHAYDQSVVSFLVDTRTGSDVPGEQGGTGVVLDWSALAPLPAGIPIVLAGGLTPENVGEAIRTLRPAAVDVSSGIE